MAITPLKIPQRYFGQPIPVAPDMNEVVDKVDELVDAVNAGLATSNAIVGGPKFVRYTDSRYFGVGAADLTLDRLDPATVLPGNLATVINSSPTPTTATAASAAYVATIVPAGTAGAFAVPAYSGAPATDTVLVAWQEVVDNSSFTALLASELAAGKADYAGLALRPLLIKIIGALGTGKTVITTTPPVTTQPAAPTAGQVDDAADTFSFVPNPAYPSFAQYKVNGLPGVTGAVVLDATNSYVQGSRIYVKVVGAVAKGGLAVYVAGSGSVPDGQVLTNADPFTGAVVTPPSPSLTAALALSLANVTLGSSVAFTITPNGGNAPYAYQVVATDNATGQQFTLGSAQTGSWTPTAVGSYAIDATVTDSSNPVKTAQAATRYLQVVAAANRIPVADAGSDATIQLPTSSMALMGTASDPDAGDTLTYAWRQVTGPSSATGLPATTLNVVVSNLVAGTYQFGFRSTDNHGAPSAEDYVLVTVQAAAGGGMPLLIVGAGDSITAGPDKGTGSDPSNAPIAFANARISAPASNYTRMGYPGQTLRWFLDNHKADAASSFLASRRGVFYFAFGANDINARTRAQREADNIEAVDWALSLPNVEVVLFIPVLNRTDQFGYALMADGTHGDFNAERLYFNNWLATTLAARSSRILVGNFSQDSALGAAGYPSNALLCSSDQVHPSVDGSRHLGERVIAELIGQLPGITLGPYTADGSSSGGGGSTTYLPSPQPITLVAKTAYEADANGRLTKNAGGMQWNSGGRAPLKIDLPNFVAGETGLLEYEQPRPGRSGVLFGATNQAFAPSDISTGDYCFYNDATFYGLWEVGSFAPATFDDGSQSGAGTLPAEAGVRQLRFTRVNANSATGDRIEWLVGGKVRRTINGKFTKQLFLVAYLNGDGSNGEAASEAPLGTVTCSKILAA